MADRKVILNELGELLHSLSVAIENSKNNNDNYVILKAERNVCELLNQLKGFHLVNANEGNLRIPGIDIIDDEAKVCIQVSTNITAHKVLQSLEVLSKTIPEDGWHFKMFILAEDNSHIDGLRKRTSLNNSAYNFRIKNDIWTFSWILQQADELETSILSEFLDFCKKVLDWIPSAVDVPFLLTNPPAMVDDVHFLCREEDEARVIRLIRAKKHLLLTNGVGGIGKSTLARKVFHTIKGDYAHAAWVTCRGSLKDDLLTDFSIFREEQEGEQSRELRLQKILEFLKQPEKKLLVVDNANQYDPMLRILSDFRDSLDILVTSRMQKLNAFEPYHLECLSPYACRSVFYSYCEALSEGEEQDVVDKLIALVQYHTFGTELLAKSLAPGENPEEFYQDLVMKGFGFPELEAESEYKRDHSEETTKIMAQQIRILFDIQKRESEEVRILQNLALMPVMPIPAQVNDWIKADGNAMKRLVKSGWLDYDKDSKTYYLHPILRETVRLNEIPGNIGMEFYECLCRQDYIQDDEPWNKALPKLDIAEAIWSECRGKKNRLFTSAGNNLAMLYWKRGLYSKAIRVFEWCIQIEEASSKPDDEYLATLYNNIALTCCDMGRLNDALEYIQKAVVIREKVLGEDHPDLASTFNNIAMIYRAVGRLGDALEYIQKTLKIREKVLVAHHPDLASTYNDIAVIYHAMGRLDDALENGLKAQEILKMVLGKDHPSLANTYNNIATIYHSRGRLEEALEYSKKDLEISERVLGVDHPSLAICYNNIAQIYRDMGRLEEALEYSQKALEIRERILGRNHPDLATSYVNIASICWRMGRLEDALECSQKALEIREKVLGAGHPDLADSYFIIARIYQGMGRLEDALEFASRAIEINLKVLGINHPNTIMAYEVAAELYLEMGQLNKARDAYQKVYELEKHSGNERRAYLNRILAQIYSEQGDYQNALRYGIDAVNQFDTAENNAFVGMQYLLLRDSAAVDYLEKALRLWSENHPTAAKLSQGRKITEELLHIAQKLEK